MFKNISKLFLAAALVTTTALAQSNNPAAQRIAGTWLVSISLENAPEPFAIDMATFHPDGSYTIISSDRNAESNGAGSYQRAGDGEFVSTHNQILYNEKGGFSAMAKVIALLKLSEKGDTFTGRYRVEVTTATGRMVAKGTGVITGKLVVPETL